MSNVVDAIILTGERAGTVVRVAEDAAQPVSQSELKQLNGSLDEVIAAVERLASTPGRTDRGAPFRHGRGNGADALLDALGTLEAEVSDLGTRHDEYLVEATGDGA